MLCVQHHLSLYKQVQKASSCVDNAEPQSYQRTQDLKRQIKKATGGEPHAPTFPARSLRLARPPAQLSARAALSHG